MNLRQAAQQARNALANARDYIYLLETGEMSWSEEEQLQEIAAAIAALCAALAEPEQEMTKQKPVAWTDGRGFIAYQADSFPRGTTVSPLYAHPPTPRKPVELTDEQIVQVLGSVRESITGNVFLAFARAIERAHGITGDGA